jgi:hypothetical protein
MVSKYTHLCLVPAFSLIIGLIALPQANAAEILNVVNYGAVGDGTTDDQVALENVFAIASRNPGSTVIFPAGIYLHSGRLSLGADVRVQGTQASLNGTTAGAQELILTGDKATIVGMTFIGQSGGDPAIVFNKLSGITIDSNNFTGFTNCVTFNEGINIYIKSNTFSPAKNGKALSITTSSSVYVQANTFTGIHQNYLQTGLTCTGNDIIVDQGNTFSNFHMAIVGGNTKALKIDQNTFSSCQTVITANGPSMSILRNNCSNGDTFFKASNVGTDKLTVESNTIANYRLVFDGFGSNTNTKVSSNTIQSVDRVFFTTFNKDIVLTGNNITDASRVFTLSNDTNVTINSNVLTRCTKPLDLRAERTVQIDKNTVTDSGAFTVSESFDVAVTGNQMTNIQYQGVQIHQNSGTSRIEGNVLKNCGLSPLYPAAVLYANGSGVISIVGNSYSGNTTNLTYFIDTTVTTSHVSGNTTNTSLPNRVGF